MLGGRDETGNILPRTNSSLFAEKPKGTADVTVYVVAQPDKYMGIEVDDCIPYGLQKNEKCLAVEVGEIPSSNQ